ncbi:hypothetical protein FW778_01935 [Ginsengibacter hankyongi]|uniref:Uncharacterized protein n=1 Tax=Ginsengibacter hankyongi TaxID=2607284 RepID=A0A5J5IIF4_9BACT|nr:hypothetical protein [Ginsengibacter hankyongi]KAA9040825.1 hypothetical protein FW778_01935 [Ginsengibacter hankyongi]
MHEDRSTPEAAILSLESAYNSKNLGAVFELIDFYCEAEIMVKKLMPKLSNEKTVISETATALRLSLQNNLIENGWPQFDNSNIVFEKQVVSQDLFIVTKILIQATGRTVIDKLYVKKQLDNTYKVAGLISE